MNDQSAMAVRVGEVLAQVLDLPPRDIAPQVSTETASAWTSLTHLMLISQLESEFGVVFSSQEVRGLTSFSAILDALERRRDSVA
jgi:acyl carrier protein